jgi:ketosteroid isomerase-like protein
MPTRHLLPTLVSVLTLVFLSTHANATTATEHAAMAQDAISETSVVNFLHQFDELANKKNFSLISDMIHEHAFFRFNDGDFVGRQAVKGAFERTWQSSSNVQNERFFLTDIVVLSSDVASATATYTYNWEGVREGRQIRIQGRGTRVLVRQQGRLQIIHEHLSHFPKVQ